MTVLNTVKGKSVLITGAGRGIGKRLALGFAAEGALVGLLARSQAELDLAKLEIEQAGGKAAARPGGGARLGARRGGGREWGCWRAVRRNSIWPGWRSNRRAARRCACAPMCAIRRNWRMRWTVCGTVSAGLAS